ncbi:hypothetical protein N0V93_003320 [Gnomoniopsis smithogilvyi]|uniref:Glycosyltransferase family 31 protein n=1 Tax=Gnomoniopsis smithogilvyi TaxID=1191159 RepID=A0A9W8YYC2_9PEZI|nr:hypothetical protein N0V93_003320 [Gnomoniopsis smithogilvyi]
MAATIMLFRSASPHHFALFAACVLIFVASVHFWDLIPDQERLTVTGTHGDGRLIHPFGHQEPLGEAKQCGTAFVHLKDLGLSKNIKYSKRCIRPVFPDDADRDIITNVSAQLITNTTIVNLDNVCSTGLDSLPCEPLELPVPKPDPESLGQYTHLLFGIATSFQRLRDSKQSFGHWLANSGATLVCMIVDEPKELLSVDFADLEAEYAVSGMKLKLVERQDMRHTPEQSHMMLIRNLLSYSAGIPTQIHWIGILDDDTFFPSLHALSTELARHDHTRSRYLGALTEDSNALQQGILAAWGGAGIFLSLALANEIEPHLEGCLSDRGGDMLIMECIHAHSHARLTTVEGLWQMDFMGDTAGIYESGRRTLSMHHWKSWHWLPVQEMAMVTHICGECFLERFIFPVPEDESPSGNGEVKSLSRTNGATVLNVGYSINLYSDGLPDLSRIEQTWDGIDAWKEYEWSVGPLRPRLAKQKKKTWWLKTAFHGSKGELTQIYLHEGGEEGKNDEIIELIFAL